MSSEVAIEPIGPKEQEEVKVLTAHYIHLATNLFQRPFDMLPVVFDLRGRCAGMYRVKKQRREIRYNPYIRQVLSG